MGEWLFFIVIVASLSLFHDALPKKFKIRCCQGRSWKQRFPETESQAIREFLWYFTESMLFKSKHGLKFNPDDKILEIYQTIYTIMGIDALELETLAEALGRSYKYDLISNWRDDLTLGEVFESVLST